VSEVIERVETYTEAKRRRDATRVWQKPTGE
jgi:hypothetical protein